MNQFVKITFWFSLVISMAHATSGVTPLAFGEGSNRRTNGGVNPFPLTHPSRDACGLAKPGGTDSEIGLNPPLAHGKSDLLNNPKIDLQKLNQQLEGGLKGFQNLAKDKGVYDSYARALGFSSVDEAVKARIGKRLRVYRVPLDRIIGYQGNANLAGLLVNDPPTVLVPILIDCTIRSSFIISERDKKKGLRIVGRGPSRFFKDRTPESLDQIDGVVHIPELRLQFLMRKLQPGVILIPIANYPLFKLEKDKEYRAADIFAKLKPLAKKVALAFADGDEEENPSNSGTYQQSQ
jgi:hypothetical protein